MTPATSQGLRVEVVEGIAVVHFMDRRIELEDQIKELCGQLYSLCEDGKYTKILINAGQVEYMLSMMFMGFIGLHKRLAIVQGQMKICCLQPLVRQSLKLCGLLRAFEVYDEEAAALDAFREGGA